MLFVLLLREGKLSASELVIRAGVGHEKKNSELIEHGASVTEFSQRGQMYGLRRKEVVHDRTDRS